MHAVVCQAQVSPCSVVMGARAGDVPGLPAATNGGCTCEGGARCLAGLSTSPMSTHSRPEYAPTAGDGDDQHVSHLAWEDRQPAQAPHLAPRGLRR